MTQLSGNDLLSHIDSKSSSSF